MKRVPPRDSSRHPSHRQAVPGETYRRKLAAFGDSPEILAAVAQLVKEVTSPNMKHRPPVAGFIAHLHKCDFAPPVGRLRLYYLVVGDFVSLVNIVRGKKDEL